MPFVLFTMAVVALVLADLALAGRRTEPMSFGRAALLSAIWIGIAVAFGFWIAHTRGSDDGYAFFAAYLIEQSLSLDNMVVFLAIFASFAVPEALQPRVLLWGVFGAIVMRGAAIFAGVALLERLDWVRYVFGAILIVGAVRLLQSHVSGERPRTTVPRLVGRVIRITPDFHGAAFFWRMNGRWSVTPLFLTLVAIELSDIVFATDSIPAVFAATRDPFLVYTSNLLAVLGLRSLYFLVAGIIPRLRYVRYGLAVILALVGARMMLADVLHISTRAFLIAIGVTMSISVVASLVPPREPPMRGL
ncbi:MAG TPA: TerC/Alx family metal homeostasis membrane protein [Gemmatimonadaceae bacterium]